MLRLKTKEGFATRLWFNRYETKDGEIIKLFSTQASTEIEEEWYNYSMNVQLSNKAKEIVEEYLEEDDNNNEILNHVDVIIRDAWLTPIIKSQGKGKNKELYADGVKIFVNKLEIASLKEKETAKKQYKKQNTSKGKRK